VIYDRIAAEEQPPGCIYCGDDEIRGVAEHLIRDAGYEPVSAGGLENARAVEEGLALLSEALPVADKAGGRYWAAELYRLKGVLLLHQPSPDVTQAETWLSQALAIARRQRVKSWELRAATSLARLWQQQGKQAEAQALLAPVYGWFTEGFDTVDLQQAKALLEELAG